MFHDFSYPGAYLNLLLRGFTHSLGPVLMEEQLYKGIRAYLRRHQISDVKREVWGARRWRYTNNGRRYADGPTQKRFKKFALLHTLRGLALFGFLLFFPLVS